MKRLAATLIVALSLLFPAAPALAYSGLPSTVYTTHNVFLRAGPGLGFLILAEMPAGEALGVLDQYTVWYQVQRANGTIGWVSGSYVTSNPGGVSIYPVPPNAGQLATVTTSLLNVRTGPGLNFPVIAQATWGTYLTVLETRAQWRFVQLNNGTRGWVNSQFLSGSLGSVQALTGSTGPTTVPIPTVIVPPNATPLEVNIVTTSKLNVRTGPGTLYAVVTVLNMGEFVTILAKQSGWRYLQTASGLRGWSHSSGVLRCDCALP